MRLFFLFFCTALHADVENYLKRLGPKEEGHSMKNIDFIYMINLDERPEKFRITAERFAPYGIVPYRFSAVNGWKLPLEVINDIGVKYGSWMRLENKGGYGYMWGTYYSLDKGGEPTHEIVQVPGRTYFSHCMSRGAIGIVMSHLSILQDADLCGYETIWVLEDDVEILQDPHCLSSLIEKLDQLVGVDGWDILFTDRDTKNKQGQHVPASGCAWRLNFTPEDLPRFYRKEAISGDFRKVGARFGAYSMIIRKSGIRKLLDFFKTYQVFLPIDIDYAMPPDIRLYTLLYDVVSPWCSASSDNGAPQYGK